MPVQRGLSWPLTAQHKRVAVGGLFVGHQQPGMGTLTNVRAP